MLAVYGDNCVDRYLRPVPAEFVGGNAVNVAVHLAALGAEVAYFGVVGDDREGAIIRDALLSHGIDCSQVETRRGKTAVTLIEVRDGERIVIDDDVGVQCPLTLTEESKRALARYSFVQCSAFTAWNVEWQRACPNIVEEVEFLHRAGIQVSLDFSELQEPELAVLLGRHLAVAFVSRGPHSTERDVEETCRFFHKCGVPEVVVTLGASGALHSGLGQKFRVPAVPIQPLDTLGAGDAFIAGWLAQRSRRADPKSCMEEATAVAAEVCSYYGAWPNAQVSGADVSVSEVNNAGSLDSRTGKT